MKYDYKILLQDIIDESEGEYTRIMKDFDYEDASVLVIGNVYQDFDYVKGDYWTPSWCDLASRTADMDSVTVHYDDEWHEFTKEELEELEKDLEL